MCDDVRPFDLWTSALFCLRFFDPSVPLTHSGDRDERGEILIAFRTAREKSGWMSVDDQLRADDRANRPLAEWARLVIVLLEAWTHCALAGRHRFGGEARDSTQIRGVRNSEMRVSHEPSVSREIFGTHRAVGK